MPKKVVKSHSSTKSRRASATRIDKQIAENLIELQKVHTNLLEKIDSLSTQLSSLLGLFEMAARSFAKSAPVKQTEKDQEFLEKIDRLLEQNKTIAKGLSLMEEKVRERMYGPPQTSSPPTQPPAGQRLPPRF